MSKCPVDPHTFWCERHQTYHIGRIYDLSQDETELGEKYRRLWDRQKGIGGQADADKKRKRCGCKK
jgi:hypothetical protein